MESNKIAALTSLILSIIIGCVLYFGSISESLNDILVGIFTGLIVAFISAIIGYFVEKQKIRKKLEKVIPNIYMNLSIVHTITGEIVSRIIYTDELSKLNYSNIMDIVELCIRGMNTSEISTYSGLSKSSLMYKTVNEITEFEIKLYNLKNCVGETLINALKVDNMQMEKFQSLNNSVLFPQEKQQIIITTRNCVNVQTAKIHEYEAALMSEIEKIAIMFIGEHKWEEQKKSILTHTDFILNKEML